ncbi:OLC1v1009501C1 [Oldenlandia corymbosa var. corymbosa]|uniref:Translation factor GUF1 homolog, mitochondrial n=1 Tax=Oldenlandia corymbosa var. corymbosa TaxID=529605 RepID=A0AAV1DRH7_OLDCO|nr:OLC1v1009501C1 [Oldenlandia corymbosa var. corymbosa]
MGSVNRAARFKYSQISNLLFSGRSRGTISAEACFDSTSRRLISPCYHLGWSQNASFCSNSARHHGKDSSSIDLNQYPSDKIRNFSIIAHVDHGKSTLADRLLELTGTIKKGHGQPQYLDKLQVERERGITVKAQTATMFHTHNFLGSDTNFLLNLIDTPGHVDFSYEVSRSLAACQGALLVVDAAQGVQAQTVANFYLAFESNLTVIPVINKIDQPTADPDRVKEQLKSMFDLDPNDALLTSAKTGLGLEKVLPAVIERIPPPPGKCTSPLRMLLLDSYYDEYKGVICHVAVVDGSITKGDKISSAATGRSYEILDVGIMHPELTPTGILLTGQVGYIVTGMRSTKEARIGDTLHHSRSHVEPLPGFKAAKHMVFSGLYPADGSDFEALNHAIERLTCNDASVSVTKESSQALGMGFRCGFLGLLHMDVFHQRLEQEHEAHVISTVPTVPYIFEYSDGSKVIVQNPASLPSDPKHRLTACMEPTVIATIIMPSEYVGAVITLCSDRRGEQLEYSFIDSQRAFMKYRLPLREIVVDFYNELKSITSGYASFDYEEAEYQASDLVKLDILLNGQPVDAMATIVHRSKAPRVGRELVDKLKKFIDRQMFEITIQAAIGSKIIARETLSALRKNVLAKCYGGDVTRKRKLLEKQKEGKKRMKRVGSVDIPQEAFHELLKVG